MKRFFSLLLLAIVAVFLVGCNDEKDDGKNTGGDNHELDTALTEGWNNFFEGKNVYLTTVGQADIDIVQNVLGVAGVEDDEYTREELLKASEVEQGSVVLVVTGSSGKGLGAAGISVADEEARAREFATRAQNDEITVIVLHVGGVDRRGATTDPIINIISPKAELLLVVQTGNQDGIFSDIAEDNDIEIVLYSRVTNLQNAFKTLTGK